MNKQIYNADKPLFDSAMAEGSQSLQNLTDPDPSVRLQAAWWIADRARAETSNLVEFWLANKEATGAIIQALDDTDPEVAEAAVCAILHTSLRYFADPRAYPGVVRVLQSRRLLARICAVQAAGFLGGEKSLQVVLPLLAERSAKEREAAINALRHVATKRISEKGRKQIRDALIPLLSDKDLDVRCSVSNLFRTVGDDSVLGHLEKQLARERNSTAKESLQMAIDEIRNRAK